MLSHVVGATAPPLIEGTIGEALAAAARTWPDVEALVSVAQNLRLTYAELLARVDALACGFLGLGLEPGDRIAIWSPNKAEWTLTQYAAARCGLILVTINPAYQAAELDYTLNKVGVRALVAAEAIKASRYCEMMEALAPEIAASTPGRLRTARVPSLEMVIQIDGTRRPGWLAFAEVAQGGGADADGLEAVARGLRADDPINIQFTSGTTGLPKGATLSHRNILNNGYFVGRAIGLSAGDRVCAPVPLYHCFGMVMANLACLTHGATVVYPSEGFEPRAALQTVAAERCTALYGVPTMFIAELAEPGFAGFDLSSLRTGIMAGSPCPIEVMRQVIDQMGMEGVTIAYGMTETSPVSLQTAMDDPVDKRVSTVGRVQPHVEVKIVDEAGATVPRGTPGEICTRGYSVMLGYWDDPEKTAQVLDVEGWMHTGDLGVLDDEGYCRIVGRIKDMVIRGGENIYPREVEEFLYSHPAIEDVQVVGLPDDRFGEELCAWVRLKPGASAAEEEIRVFCRGQIAHYKIPRYVRFVDSFPMTVTGKVQKYLIRQAMIEELGLVARETA
jgi:fatty-acyl-CoA synthase